MAVYCGACGDRLSDAAENYGGFSVASSFVNGWDQQHASGAGGRRVKRPRINDTCLSCAKVLEEAVAQAATKIAAEHAPAIEALKRNVETWEVKLAADKKEREEFEREWAARKAAKAST